jgi:hypothetical protein
MAGPATCLLVTQMQEKGSGFTSKKTELAEMWIHIMKVAYLGGAV